MGEVYKTRHELVQEIRRLAEARGDIMDCEELLAEVRSHLDASIQARLELGQFLEDAETEAVASFGSPTEFVAGVLVSRRSDRRPGIKTFWIGLAATTVSAIPCTLFVELDPAPLVILLAYLPVVAASIAIARLCIRNRKSHFLPLVAGSVVSVFAAAILLSTFAIAQNGGFVMKHQLRARVADAKAEQVRIEGIRAHIMSLQFPQEKLGRTAKGTFPAAIFLDDSVTKIEWANWASTQDQALKYFESQKDGRDGKWAGFIVMLDQEIARASNELATPRWPNVKRWVPLVIAGSAPLWAILLLGQLVAALKAKQRRPRQEMIHG